MHWTDKNHGPNATQYNPTQPVDGPKPMYISQVFMFEIGLLKLL